MKKIFLMTLCILLAFSVSALDRLYINDFTIRPQETKQVELILENYNEYTALQADIPASRLVDRAAGW